MVKIIQTEDLQLELLYNVCPVCGHDWIAHFAMIDYETSDLANPYPSTCMDCGTCTYALDLMNIKECYGQRLEKS